MSGTDPFNLERFVEAQNPVIDTVLKELRSGKKQSHWMWFIFPQLRGLGHSAMADFYGISSVEEAKAYLKHPILGERLLLCTQVLLCTHAAMDASMNGTEALCIMFGSPDDKKFCSSMTLFAIAAGRKDSLFEQVIHTLCDGIKDASSLALIA